MKNALVAGIGKTGTTIVASVIHKSLAGSLLYFEPAHVTFFEKRHNATSPLVVKMLYEHWMHRPFLLNGVVRGETGFHFEKSVALVRDPRDTLVSALMYITYERVIVGASRQQVQNWVAVLREKEADPQSHSLAHLIEELSRIFGAPYDPNWIFEYFTNYVWWIASSGADWFVLKYEDFVAGNTAELTQYLGFELTSSREVDPSVQRVARTRASGAWRRMMLPEDVTRWQQRYGRTLAAYGYDDWETGAEPCDPAEGSDYVLRIAEEAFNSNQRKADPAAIRLAG